MIRAASGAMSKGNSQPDVFVLGEHPCALLAATLLKEKSLVGVAHCSIPGEAPVDRLVILNPQFFKLHPCLEKIRKKVDCTNIFGLQFVADDGTTRGEFKSKTAIAMVASYEQIRALVHEMAMEAGVQCKTVSAIRVSGVDEKGVTLEIDGENVTPRALLVAGKLSPADAKTLGFPDDFEADVLRRYTFVRLRGSHWSEMESKPAPPMSLDLKGKLTWAWMLPGKEEIQLSVEQPMASTQETPPKELLAHWGNVLAKHGFLKSNGGLPLDEAVSLDLPMAGALAREGVASRTLLLGPAGGFYSASAEDIYPNCWSALFAADAMRKALKEPHLQDALQPYREKWGATLGDYLRGPQQNLRFLLPLVYRNPVMASRMAESILLGKSVVR